MSSHGGSRPGSQAGSHHSSRPASSVGSSVMSMATTGGRDVYNSISISNGILANMEKSLFAFLYAVTKENKIIGGDYLSVILLVFGTLQLLSAILGQMRTDIPYVSDVVDIVIAPFSIRSAMIYEFSSAVYFCLLGAVVVFIFSIVSIGVIYGYYFTRGVPRILFPLRILRIAITLLLSVIIIPALNILFYPLTELSWSMNWATVVAPFSVTLGIILIMYGTAISLVFFDRSIRSPSAFARRTGLPDLLLFMTKAFITVVKYTNGIVYIKFILLVGVLLFALAHLVTHVTLVPYLRRSTQAIVTLLGSLVVCSSIVTVSVTVTEMLSEFTSYKENEIMWGTVAVSSCSLVLVPLPMIFCYIHIRLVSYNLYKNSLARYFSDLRLKIRRRREDADGATRQGITFMGGAGDEDTEDDEPLSLTAVDLVAHSNHTALPSTKKLLTLIDRYPNVSAPRWARQPESYTRKLKMRFRSVSAEHAIRFLIHAVSNDDRLREAIDKMVMEAIDQVRGIGDKRNALNRAYLTPLDRFCESELMKSTNKHDIGFHTLKGKIKFQDIEHFIPKNLRPFGQDIGVLYDNMTKAYRERARLLLRITDEVTLAATRMYANDARVAMVRADFLDSFGTVLYGATKTNVVTELQRCGQTRPSMLTRFHIYTYQRAFEDMDGHHPTAGASVDFMRRLDYSRKLKTAHRAHRRCVRLLHQFWEAIEIKNQTTAMNVVASFIENESIAMRTYLHLVRKFPEKKDVYREFGVFLEEVCDEDEAAKQMFTFGDIAEDNEGQVDMGAGFELGVSGQAKQSIFNAIGKKIKRNQSRSAEQLSSAGRSKMSDTVSESSAGMSSLEDEEDTNDRLAAKSLVDIPLRRRLILFHGVVAGTILFTLLLFPLLFLGSYDYSKLMGVIHDFGHVQVAANRMAITARAALTAGYLGVTDLASFNAARIATAGDETEVQCYMAPEFVIAQIEEDVSVLRSHLDEIYTTINNDYISQAVAYLLAPLGLVFDSFEFSPTEVFFDRVIPSLAKSTEETLSYYEMGLSLALHGETVSEFVSGGFVDPATPAEYRSLLLNGPVTFTSATNYLINRLLLEMLILSALTLIFMFCLSCTAPMVMTVLGTYIYRRSANKMISSRAIALTLFDSIPKGIVQDRVFMYDKKSRARFADEEAALLDELMDQSDMLVTAVGAEGSDPPISDRVSQAGSEDKGSAGSGDSDVSETDSMIMARVAKGLSGSFATLRSNISTSRRSSTSSRGGPLLSPLRRATDPALYQGHRRTSIVSSAMSIEEDPYEDYYDTTVTSDSDEARTLSQHGSSAVYPSFTLPSEDKPASPADVNASQAMPLPLDLPEQTPSHHGSVADSPPATHDQMIIVPGATPGQETNAEAASPGKKKKPRGMTFEEFKKIDQATIDKVVYDGKRPDDIVNARAEKMKAAREGKLEKSDEVSDAARQVQFGMSSVMTRMMWRWFGGLLVLWLTTTILCVIPGAIFLAMQYVPPIAVNAIVRQVDSLGLAHWVQEAQLNRTVIEQSFSAADIEALGAVTVTQPESSALTRSMLASLSEDLFSAVSEANTELMQSHADAVTGFGSSNIFTGIMATDVYALTYETLDCQLDPKYESHCTDDTLTSDFPLHRPSFYVESIMSYGIDGLVRTAIERASESAKEEETAELVTAFILTDLFNAQVAVVDGYVDTIQFLASALEVLIIIILVFLPIMSVFIYLITIRPVVSSLLIQSKVGLRLMNLIPKEVAEQEFVVWDDSFSTGIETFDRQHRKLFALINSLHQGMIMNDHLKIDGVLRGLINYTVVHFENEAKYMREYGYPRTVGHLQQHDIFTDQMKEFYIQHQRGQVDVDIQLLGFLKEWLINHIKKEDFKYTPFMKANVPEFHS
ncbi:Hemerythrin HHE cation binding domain [Carpediemonas membranifera]|uniref:Hemerythrin HHE cation binding domain n=1 Tax=Carpediemonas membranifera TaxID=201153 RepID=A0A8J6AYS3_9EUKA|nr:Hemerythrin HHE cation binding domain [Carpediemonas membranifera]|eukprot:KAG9394725.1 Hemerythrin HHE cation binding domain [Carpediemonas membranifera]